MKQRWLPARKKKNWDAESLRRAECLSVRLTLIQSANLTNFLVRLLTIAHCFAAGRALPHPPLVPLLYCVDLSRCRSRRCRRFSRPYPTRTSILGFFPQHRAMETAGPAPTSVPPAGNRQALPFYDYFLDLPHPSASASCPPPIVVAGPANGPEIEKELTANLSRIARFAFPEFDDAAVSAGTSRIPRDTALNRFSQYAMQPKTFQNYTFSMQLQSGVRLHGHVRRYLPVHEIAKHRYDVGRRGERALVIMTRSSGGDLVYAAVLKYVSPGVCEKTVVVMLNGYMSNVVV